MRRCVNGHALTEVVASSHYALQSWRHPTCHADLPDGLMTNFTAEGIARERSLSPDGISLRLPGVPDFSRREACTSR